MQDFATAERQGKRSRDPGWIDARSKTKRNFGVCGSLSRKDTVYLNARRPDPSVSSQTESTERQMQKAPLLQSMRRPCCTCRAGTSCEGSNWPLHCSSKKRLAYSSSSNDKKRRRRKMIAVSGLAFGITLAFAAVPRRTMAMRIPRPWGEASACERAVDPEWPFVYSKYRGQEVCIQV